VGKRFGVYDEVPRNFSIVLGAAETSLLRLANAYAMIVNGGKKVAPALVERIDDRHGRTIFRRDTRSCAGCAITDASTINPDTLPPIPADTREQVVDPRVAYQMVSMMEGVVQRGTGVRAKAVGKPLAGKTGTTNESRDTWFVGFSPDLVAGVFVGYDRPQTLGKKETGASVALPAFVSFMKDALADKPATPFRTPRGVQLVRVDLKTGTPAQEPSPGSKIIQEAFLSGDPVWLPPSAQDAAAKSPQIAPPAEPGAAVVGEEGLPQPVQVPAPTHGGDRPVVGTGGLY
jgi:penicillin-binding protein 1A